MTQPRIDAPVLTPQQVEYFWSKIDKTPGQGPHGTCWQWCAGVTSKGYGRIKFNRRKLNAHRLAFFLHYGIWSTVFICHRCDNPPCCNPACLFEGDAKANTEDAKAKGRLASGDRHHSHLHPERLYRGDDHWTHKKPERVARGEKVGLRRHPEAVLRGSLAKNAKLTESVIPEIFRLRRLGWSQRVIGEHLGVDQTAISQVLTGKTWQHASAPFLTVQARK